MKVALKFVTSSVMFLSLLSACSVKQSTAVSSRGSWTWVSGSNAANQPGNYGTLGQATPSNVPGARVSGIAWTSPQNNFCLFGGYGYDSTGTIGNLNDLWEYNPATLEWTWVSGSSTVAQAGLYGTQGLAAPSNVPGARSSAVSWIDSNGNLWLFGGEGSATTGSYGCLNDLWEYSPTTLEWTWVSGEDTANQAGIYGTKGSPDASNLPGGRYAAVSWIDSQGNLWMFGGYGYDSAGLKGDLSDLWEYDPALLEWTWVSGSDVIYQAGNYGTKGVTAPSNVPGAREGAVSWVDHQGNFWLFGGYGWDSAGSSGNFNDLWELNLTTHEWTWMSGSNTGNQTGFYGTQGTPSLSNIPGARQGAVAWTDSNSNLWLFGGVEGVCNFFNDLWEFDQNDLTWTWVSGSNSINQAGDYGTKDTAAPSNVPGARGGPVSWIDSGGNLWFFGGSYYVYGYFIYSYNDLWEYKP